MRRLLQELYESYYQDIYRYLYSLCRDASLAQDLTSETFMEAVRSIGTFQGRSDVKTWLFSIARFRWLGYLRKKRTEPEILPQLLPQERIAPEDAILLRQAACRVRQLLEAESERNRTIVNMRLKGYSFHEIAASEGISENSARVIYFRVREKLRKTLVKEGYCDE